MAITEQQRQERRKYLGSSDMPAVMGVSPYKTALDVWVDKIEPPKNDTPTHSMKTGNFMEAAMAEFVRHELGLRGSGGQMIVDENGVLAVNLDFLTEDAATLCEFKFVGAKYREHWGEPGTDDIPDYVSVQVQTQLTVAKVQRAIVVAAMPSDFGLDFHPYYVSPHERLITAIRSAAQVFMAAYVVPKIRPPFEGLPDFDTLAKLPRIKGTAREVTSRTLLTYAAVRELRLMAEKAEKVAAARLLLEQDDAETATCAGGWQVRRGTVNKVDVDRNKLRAAGLLQEYSSPISYQQNYVKGPKGASALDALDAHARHLAVTDDGSRDDELVDLQTATEIMKSSTFALDTLANKQGASDVGSGNGSAGAGE